MGLTGLEPVTLPLSGARSNQSELEALDWFKGRHLNKGIKGKAI